MFSKLWQWLKRLAGAGGTSEAESVRYEGFGRKYAECAKLNLTAVVANKIANVACSDSDVALVGAGKRALLLAEAVNPVLDKLKIVAARALGVGGVVLKPRVCDGRLEVELLNQDRAVVLERSGSDIRKIAFVAETFDSADGELVRVELHSRDGKGGYVIEQRALKNGREVPLTGCAAWAELPARQEMRGVFGHLFGWVKCPVDDRRDGQSLFGVPVTFGCETLMVEILEQLDIFQSEIVDKRTFIGADYRLFKRDDAGRERLLPQANIFKKFDAAGGIDDKPFFEIYSPDMRVGALSDAVNFRLGLLEKAIGVNRGVLTDLAAADATATAIKRSTVDTFSLVDALRGEIERGLNQLLFACNVLADVCRLPMGGKAELKFDWSYALIEDSAETFAQLAQGVGLGAVGADELRGWLALPVSGAQ